MLFQVKGFEIVGNQMEQQMVTEDLSGIMFRITAVSLGSMQGLLQGSIPPLATHLILKPTNNLNPKALLSWPSWSSADARLAKAML